MKKENMCVRLDGDDFTVVKSSRHFRKGTFPTPRKMPKSVDIELIKDIQSVDPVFDYDITDIEILDITFAATNIDEFI